MSVAGDDSHRTRSHIRVMSPGGTACIIATLFFVSSFIPSQILAQHLRIYACAIANDSAGAFMGGSSNGSGLYQSDDTGRTWTHLGWSNIKCYAMDMDRSSNGRILYEATGLGVLRSTDYGATWKQLTDWRVSEVMDIAVDQRNPDMIYIATAHGPWRSKDAGASWQLLDRGLASPYCSHIVVDSVLDQHVLLATWDGIYSLNGGDGWDNIPNGYSKDFKVVRDFRPVTSLVQVNHAFWVASEWGEPCVFSMDSAKKFGVPSFTQKDSLWTLIAVGEDPWHCKYIGGGPKGRWYLRSLNDLTINMGYVSREKIDPESTLMNVVSDKDWNGRTIHDVIGTLGEGIYGVNHLLQGRQIWSMRGFQMQE